MGEGIPTLQWTGPGVTSGEAIEGTQTQSGTIFTRNLTFSPLNTSHGGVYTYQSTVGSGAVERTAMTTVSVQSKLVITPRVYALAGLSDCFCLPRARMR